MMPSGTRLKSGSITKFAGALLAAAMIVELDIDYLKAEEAIKFDSVQNELLKKSLPKDNAGTAEISERDLDVADRRLKAAEQRLLQKAGITGSAPQPAFSSSDSGTSSTTLRLPPAELPAQHSEMPQTVKPPQRAAVDGQKLIPEVVSGPAAVSDRPAAVTIAGIPSPAPLAQVADLQQRNAQLEAELKSAAERAGALAKELDEVRNRLMIAETQVERLSVIIESRGKDPASATARRSPPRVTNTSASRPPDDAQIATVVADKVYLRTGPGKENSPLMAVTKGTTLTVETRSGDWYRVVAPTGRRAWISGDVVAFGLNPRTNFGQTSRVKGFDANLDDGFGSSR